MIAHESIQCIVSNTFKNLRILQRKIRTIEIYDSNDKLDLLAMQYRMKHPRARRVRARKTESVKTSRPILVEKQPIVRVDPPNFSSITHDEKPNLTEVEWIERKNGSVRKGLLAISNQRSFCLDCTTPCARGKRIQRAAKKNRKQQLIVEMLLRNRIDPRRSISEDEEFYFAVTFARQIAKKVKLRDGFYSCVRVDGELKLVPLKATLAMWQREELE